MIRYKGQHRPMVPRYNDGMNPRSLAFKAYNDAAMQEANNNLVSKRRKFTPEEEEMLLAQLQQYQQDRLNGENMLAHDQYNQGQQQVTGLYANGGRVPRYGNGVKDILLNYVAPAAMGGAALAGTTYGLYDHFREVPPIEIPEGDAYGGLVVRPAATPGGDRGGYSIPKPPSGAGLQRPFSKAEGEMFVDRVDNMSDSEPSDLDLESINYGDGDVVYSKTHVPYVDDNEFDPTRGAKPVVLNDGPFSAKKTQSMIVGNTPVDHKKIIKAGHYPPGLDKRLRWDDTHNTNRRKQEFHKMSRNPELAQKIGLQGIVDSYSDSDAREFLPMETNNEHMENQAKPYPKHMNTLYHMGNGGAKQLSLSDDDIDLDKEIADIEYADTLGMFTPKTGYEPKQHGKIPKDMFIPSADGPSTFNYDKYGPPKSMNEFEPEWKESAPKSISGQILPPSPKHIIGTSRYVPRPHQKVANPVGYTKSTNSEAGGWKQPSQKSTFVPTRPKPFVQANPIRPHQKVATPVGYIKSTKGEAGGWAPPKLPDGRDIKQVGSMVMSVNPKPAPVIRRFDENSLIPPHKQGEARYYRKNLNTGHIEYADVEIGKDQDFAVDSNWKRSPHAAINNLADGGRVARYADGKKNEVLGAALTGLIGGTALAPPIAMGVDRLQDYVEARRAAAQVQPEVEQIVPGPAPQPPDASFNSDPLPFNMREYSTIDGGRMPGYTPERAIVDPANPNNFIMVPGGRPMGTYTSYGPTKPPHYRTPEASEADLEEMNREVGRMPQYRYEWDEPIGQAEISDSEIDDLLQGDNLGKILPDKSEVGDRVFYAPEEERLGGNDESKFIFPESRHFEQRLANEREAERNQFNDNARLMGYEASGRMRVDGELMQPNGGIQPNGQPYGNEGDRTPYPQGVKVFHDLGWKQQPSDDYLADKYRANLSFDSQDIDLDADINDLGNGPHYNNPNHEDRHYQRIPEGTFDEQGNLDPRHVKRPGMMTIQYGKGWRNFRRFNNPIVGPTPATRIESNGVEMPIGNGKPFPPPYPKPWDPAKSYLSPASRQNYERIQQYKDHPELFGTHINHLYGSDSSHSSYENIPNANMLSDTIVPTWEDELNETPGFEDLKKYNKELDEFYLKPLREEAQRREASGGSKPLSKSIVRSKHDAK